MEIKYNHLSRTLVVKKGKQGVQIATHLTFCDKMPVEKFKELLGFAAKTINMTEEETKKVLEYFCTKVK